ncbi:hypothetical protein GCM10027296_35580 [Chitinimonas naiadis]
MILLVSDTSVLIDLERAGLLATAFSCEITMVVPDLLYGRELANFNGPYLRSLGMGVVELTPEEVSVAQQVKSERPALSLADCFALVCSLRPNHCLMSGDKALRTEAASKGATVFGLLWLMDRMEERGVPTQTLANGLESILSHRGARLPRDEVEARMTRWRQ